MHLKKTIDSEGIEALLSYTNVQKLTFEAYFSAKFSPLPRKIIFSLKSELLFELLLHSSRIRSSSMFMCGVAV